MVRFSGLRPVSQVFIPGRGEEQQLEKSWQSSLRPPKKLQAVCFWTGSLAVNSLVQVSFHVGTGIAGEIFTRTVPELQVFVV